MSVCNEYGWNIRVYVRLHTFLACAAHGTITMENLEDSRWQQAREQFRRYRKGLTYQQRNEGQQDNSDRSNLLHLLTCKFLTSLWPHFAICSAWDTWWYLQQNGLQLNIRTKFDWWLTLWNFHASVQLYLKKSARSRSLMHEVNLLFTTFWDEDKFLTAYFSRTEKKKKNCS